MLHEELRKFISDNFMDRVVDFCVSMFVVLGK